MEKLDPSNPLILILTSVCLKNTTRPGVQCPRDPSPGVQGLFEHVPELCQEVIPDDLAPYERKRRWRYVLSGVKLYDIYIYIWSLQPLQPSTMGCQPLLWFWASSWLRRIRSRNTSQLGLKHIWNTMPQTQNQSNPVISTLLNRVHRHTDQSCDHKQPPGPNGPEAMSRRVAIVSGRRTPKGPEREAPSFHRAPDLQRVGLRAAKPHLVTCVTVFLFPDAWRTEHVLKWRQHATRDPGTLGQGKC